MSLISPAVWMADTPITLANSATESTLIPATGFGSVTIPAGQVYPGKYFIIKGSGVFSTAPVAPSFTMKLYLGSHVLASATLTNLISNAANNAFDFECEIACRTAGTSGTVVIAGEVNYATALNMRGFGDLTNAGSIVTIDTTTTQAFNVTGTWGTANAANTITVNTSTIRQLSFT